MNQLHLNGLEMFGKNLESFLMFLNFKAHLSHKAYFFTHNLVQFLVLIVGIRWKVLIQVVLCDSVNNVVGHT